MWGKGVERMSSVFVVVGRASLELDTVAMQSSVFTNIYG